MGALMYERRKHKLLERPAFLHRAGRHLLWAIVIGLGAVGIGTFGYHAAGRLPWVDAFLNASMILGDGPVDRMETTGAKIFGAIRAFSGPPSSASRLVIAPWLHRLFH